MLDMGFIHDVTRILDKIPSRRNLGMFSATISREVMDISWMYQRDPEEITVQAKEENKPDIAQYRIDVGQNDKAHVMAQIIRAEGHERDILQYAVTVEQTDKVAAMARIIRQEKLERVMVFCNTKGMVERLTKYLEMEGLDAACIHGDIPQKKREQVMARFRRGPRHRRGRRGRGVQLRRAAGERILRPPHRTHGPREASRRRLHARGGLPEQDAARRHRQVHRKRRQARPLRG